LRTIEWLIVGELVAAQGLKGDLRINPISDFPERFTKKGKRWLQKDDDLPRRIQLICGRKVPGKSIFIISIEGINDRESAESLIGQKLLVPAKDRPKLNDNEFHLLDLLALEVRLDPYGKSIGEVTDLTQAGNDLLEVQLIEGKKILIPFVKAIVPEVNIEDGWILITPPPGLLEI
tara:strand:- start:717 stop:1244 length:528 start_codon:yes stop_codon:yes gene_type:complete